MPADAIAGYRILEPLGQGSVGTVYRAVHLAMQREVALKVLGQARSGDKDFVQRFLREAQLAGAVNHPNVVACHDAGKAGALVYQAQELVDGGDLAALLAEGPLSETEAVAIGLDCARGLEALHAVGLVHGDLHPGSIYMTVDGGAKLGDLGLARSQFESGEAHALRRQTGFLAPELSAGSGVADRASDIYAIGAVLHHALTGRPPFIPADAEERQWVGGDGGGADPRQLDPDVSDGVASIVRRCTAPDRRDRYADATRLREDLERAAMRFAPLHARLRSETRHRSSDGESISGIRRTTVRRQVRSVQPALEPRSSPPPVPHQPTTAAMRQHLRWAVPLLGLVLFGGAMMLWPDGASQPTSDTPPPANTGPGVAVVAVAAEPPAAVTPQPVLTAPPLRLPEPAPPSGPAWAVRSGTDELGRWAEVDLVGVVVRMRLCPAGTFTMGAADLADARPQRVMLSRNYWLAETEVCRQLWQAVMGRDPSHHPSEDLHLPVESVSWDDCQRFLADLRLLKSDWPVRLPTEAEWEYACQAGTGAESVAASASAWSADTARLHPHPVGSLAPNPWGLRDLLGNVLEWCQDGYAPYRGDGTDPGGPDGPQVLFRVARGGAWSLPAAHCRGAARSRYQPNKRLFFIGLRLAADAE